MTFMRAFVELKTFEKHMEIGQKLQLVCRKWIETSPFKPTWLALSGS